MIDLSCLSYGQYFHSTYWQVYDDTKLLPIFIKLRACVSTKELCVGNIDMISFIDLLYGLWGMFLIFTSLSKIPQVRGIFLTYNSLHSVQNTYTYTVYTIHIALLIHTHLKLTTRTLTGMSDSIWAKTDKKNQNRLWKNECEAKFSIKICGVVVVPSFRLSMSPRYVHSWRILFYDYLNNLWAPLISLSAIKIMIGQTIILCPKSFCNLLIIKSYSKLNKINEFQYHRHRLALECR